MYIINFILFLVFYYILRFQSNRETKIFLSPHELHLNAYLSILLNIRADRKLSLQFTQKFVKFFRLGGWFGKNLFCLILAVGKK